MTDYTIFDTVDKVEVTKHLYYLSNAIARDMANQGRDFKISTYTSIVSSAYPMRNKTALKRGQVIGKKLLDGTSLNSGDSLIRGSDMAKTVSYVLTNEGGYDWPEVRAYLQSIGGPFAQLEKELKLDPNNRVQQILKKEINTINTSGGSVAAELRRIAKMVEPLEADIKYLASTIEMQNLTIVNKSNENTELIQQINRIKAHLAELKAMIDDEDDDNLKAVMQKKYDDISDMI